MKKGALGDWLIHFALGAAMAGIVLWLGVLIGALWAVWLTPPVALALGTLREWVQHRDDVPVWTGHRISEALAWGFGALLPAGVFALTR